MFPAKLTLRLAVSLPEQFGRVVVMEKTRRAPVVVDGPRWPGEGSVACPK